MSVVVLWHEQHVMSDAQVMRTKVREQVAVNGQHPLLRLLLTVSLYYHAALQREGYAYQILRHYSTSSRAALAARHCASSSWHEALVPSYRKVRSTVSCMSLSSKCAQYATQQRQ